MARTKKTSTKADPLDDLEREIAEDLGEEFDFEDGAEESTEGEASGNEASKAAAALLGKTVTFTNDDGQKVTGEVVEAGTTDEDSGEYDPDGLIVEDENNFWETSVGDCAVHEAQVEQPARAKTSGRAKKAEPEEGAEEKSEGGTTERRMLEIGAVQVPRDKPRDVDKESPRYKRILSDMHKRGQRDAIKVESFDRPVLVDGLRRLSIAEDLGWTHIECQEDTKIEDSDDRLYNGLMDNEAREAMSWVDVGRTCAKLAASGKYSQRKLARSLGVSESQVSRMVGAASSNGLPKDLLAIAENGTVDPGDEKNVSYSMSVFFELNSSESVVQDKALALMREGKPLTLADVRELKKADKKGRKARGEEVPEEKRGGSRSDGANSTTYKTLSSADIGDWIKLKVLKDEVVLQVTIDWSKKTFRGFDPVAEVKEAFDVVYGDQTTAIDSHEALAKALSSARKELD